MFSLRQSTSFIGIGRETRTSEHKTTTGQGSADSFETRKKQISIRLPMA
jgi:hypothetical protein